MMGDPSYNDMAGKFVTIYLVRSISDVRLMDKIALRVGLILICSALILINWSILILCLIFAYDVRCVPAHDTANIPPNYPLPGLF